MTQHYFDPDDIANALNEGKEILDCLNNQMNAYVWWYLRTPNCNLINDDGSIKLKGSVMGPFSKYVRPGSYRLIATYSPQSGVPVMAFTGTKNVIIALYLLFDIINYPGTNTVSQRTKRNIDYRITNLEYRSEMRYKMNIEMHQICIALFKTR